jgi:hypothetical protein
MGGRSVDRLRARADTLEAAHRAQIEVLIQVLRRAERLVAKRGDKQTATRLHHLQSALAEPLPSESAVLAPPLAAGLQTVRELTGAGAIAPKEGDPLFDDPAAVAAAVGRRIDEHRTIVEETAALERDLRNSPVALERERLAGRLRQLDHRVAVLEDERAGLARVAEQKSRERAALLEGLGEEIGAVFGGRVRFEQEEA